MDRDKVLSATDLHKEYKPLVAVNMASTHTPSIPHESIHSPTYEETCDLPLPPRGVVVQSLIPVR